MGQTVGLTLDPRKREPLYRQIFDQVVARIETRAFPPGYKLPPTRALARELATHRNTVVRAYADLEAAGFVTSTVGRGTFVEAALAGALPAKASRAKSANRAADSDEVAQGAPIPWPSLVSRAGKSEVLARGERYPRRVDRRDVVNCARMQPSADLLPDDLVRRCIARALADVKAGAMIYAPPEGVARLREQIALELTGRGVPTVADDVTVTSGSQQALDLVARALLEPGDAVVVEATTYSGAIDVFTLAGARLVTVPTDAEGPDVAALNRLSRQGVKAFYVMPNGHNPTGRTMSAARRRAIVAWSRASGIPIIEDDYCAGLALDGAPNPHLRALDGDVIHLSTFSKRLVPALRVGYVVAPPALRGTLRSVKRVVDLGTSPIIQHALAELMERGYLRAHMTKVVAEYRRRLDALAEALARSLPEGVTFERPNHGIVVWVKLPRGVEPDAVYAAALEQGVLVTPTAVWAADGTAEPGVRLAFCAEPAERLALAAKRLGKAIRHVLDTSPRKTTQERADFEVV
ncbi:MAG: PLP-dependent aminotransferase family protein [Deltaproteobacteria bacterium]|nr:PLP-dependent aminotransferase family protein [Deltaproteobacteria bacterium]